ncbi:restriction endonuclease [Kocuria sp.]|uniref:restriction endonuclease n=1 Tax=Kocuria sp. TaxID=1871328 RepID=UPI0026DDB7DE|nr:restriction endonuclease [Kocuria sp.]MDO4919080.1 restriction endonuclease [Kocuria sp.]
MTMWGIHNDVLADELLSEGFFSIGWEIGDISLMGDDPERIKAALLASEPNAKAGAIAVWAGIQRRFAFEMAVGDLVIFPNKADRTLNFGEVVGEYRYHSDQKTHRHRRAVRWLKTGVSRGIFPKPALYEIGSALTLFRVKRHEGIFRDFLQAPSEDAFVRSLQAREDAQPLSTSPIGALPMVAESDEEANDALPTAEQIQVNTNDFITRTLLEDLTHEEFEHFVADLLRAMGYQARVTSYSADGGVDVLAHRDILGLEPPLIKVQCKHTSSTKGRPDIQGLLGTLGVKDEHGLFVTLGSYTSEAAALERERHNLRLLGYKEITDLTLTYYESLPSRWRDKLPLKRIYVVAEKVS